MYLNRVAVDRFPVRASPPSPPARAAAPRPEPPPRSAAPPSAPAAAQESIRTTAQPAPLASPATPAALAIAIHLAVLAPVRPSRGVVRPAVTAILGRQQCSVRAGWSENRFRESAVTALCPEFRRDE